MLSFGVDAKIRSLNASYTVILCKFLSDSKPFRAYLVCCLTVSPPVSPTDSTEP